MNYHTYGAMVIRPPEDELGPDFGAYDALTRLGCELTGYAEVVLSNKWMHGDSVAWAIEHRGIVSFCNELWNAMEHVLKQHGEEFDHTADLGSGPVTPDMVGTREEDYARLYAWCVPGRFPLARAMATTLQGSVHSSATQSVLQSS